MLLESVPNLWTEFRLFDTGHIDTMVICDTYCGSEVLFQDFRRHMTFVDGDDDDDVWIFTYVQSAINICQDYQALTNV